jgi:hypothetical protein
MKNLILSLMALIAVFGVFTLIQTIMPNSNVITNAIADDPILLPCPSRTVWMERVGDFCWLKANMCIDVERAYYLRYDETDLNGWSYILMYENALNVCAEGCYYYTCARGPINCETYVYQVGYYNGETWVIVYPNPNDPDEYGWVIPPLG